MTDYKKLQNGSDIRGIAIVDRGRAMAGLPVQMPNLTAEAAADIAVGFLTWLTERSGKRPQELKLAIGRDPRITGATLTDGLMQGFGPYGCRVLDCGLASTPAMFMATVFPDFACDGTIMITASHLPFDRNGFKFFTRDGGLDKKDIARILEVAAEVAQVREQGAGGQGVAAGQGDRTSQANVNGEGNGIGSGAENCNDVGVNGADASTEPDSGAAPRSPGTVSTDRVDPAASAGTSTTADQVLGEPTNADGSILRSGERIFPAEEADIIGPYSAHLRHLIIDGCGMGEKPLQGMKITVDAGNGAGGFYARKVLRPLGADISSSQFLDPDGMFENHAPNPEDRAAMHSVSMQTLASQSDLGIIFDTDVDRSAAVDSRGREIARNGIVALAAALVAEEHPGTTVVTDSITSRQLTAFLEDDLGLRHLRFKRGYRNVINKAVELNAAGTDCQLAIETSGHAALKENYFLDDGAYLATKIVIRAARLKAEGKHIESLIETLTEPADEKEVRIPVTAADFGTYGDRVLAELEKAVADAGDASETVATTAPTQAAGDTSNLGVSGEADNDAASTQTANDTSTSVAASQANRDASCEAADGNVPGETATSFRQVAQRLGLTLEQPNYEGVRINFPGGWCLLRKSLHDPILPMNMASDVPGGCEEILQTMVSFLSGYEGLDLSGLGI